MSDKQSQQPKRWLVPFPEKKARTGHPCQDACNGNQKMGYLLNYFLCEASWELERQDLPESCKVVKFTRSHEHILKRVNISEKSLVQFLKQFNAWEFVLSEQYGKTFTVQAEPIRKAMYNPVFTKKTRKSCTSTSETSDNFTTSCQDDDTEKSCNVYLLQQKVEALEEVQLYNITLEARIQALSEALEEESCKVVKLGQEVEAGKLYNSTLSTWIEAVSQALKIPSPFIDSGDIDLRDSNKESNSAHTDTFAPPHVGALSLSNNDNHSHSGSTGLQEMAEPLIAPPATGTTHPEGDTHAQPLPSVPTANHLNRGSSDVPGDSQVDSTGTSSALDAAPVDRAAGSDAVGREGRAGVGEDTARGIGSREAREAGAAGDTARGQVDEGDDHAHLPAGSARGAGALPGSSGDSHDAAVDDRHVVAPETGPDVATGREEIDTLGRAWQHVDPEQIAPREDVPVVAASPLDTSTVEPGHGGWDAMPVAPVPGQEGVKPARSRQSKVKPIPEGPPVMPVEDAPWCAETIVQICEARRGRRYPNGAKRKSDRERDVQLEYAKQLAEMPDIDREKLLKAASHQETRHDNWWMETNGYISPKQLVEKDRIHDRLDELMRLERKKSLRLVSQNGSANGAEKPTNQPTTNIRELVRQREAARAAQMQ